MLSTLLKIQSMKRSILSLFNQSQLPLSDTQEHSAKLNQLKRSMLSLVSDVSLPPTSNLIYRTTNARSATELWLLRVDFYQALAKEYGQSVASQRINSLLPLFELLIPAHMLSPV
jgi:hypothetical protein